MISIMIHPRILGVRFDGASMDEVLDMVGGFLRSGTSHMVVTPNPEICVVGYHDLAYRFILARADLSIPDGFGILWAARYLDGQRGFLRWIWTLLTPWWNTALSPLKERVTGVDVMTAICTRYANQKIFLLGASEAVNSRTAEVLRERFDANVVGNFSGSDREEEEEIILEMIQRSSATIVFVAFGAPKQERWMYRNLSRMNGVRVVMGVGGAFDFLIGYRRRAPLFLRRLGVEWLFRLFLQPSRMSRIWRAVVRFPWLVLRVKDE